LEVIPMRLSIAMVLAVAVAGCGNKDTGGDMAVPPDMTMMATGDMTMNSTCSITAQDCGSGMKCIPTVSGMNLVGKCGADGTVAEGGDCVAGMSQTQLTDNCVAGTICDNTGTGNDMTFKCRKICSADSGCAGTDRCLAFDVFGWCLPTCTPTFTGTDSCAVGSDCGTWWPDISSTMTTNNGFFTCKQTGAGTVFSDCMGDSDCGAHLWCDTLQGGTNTCLELCDSTHMCSTPPADAGITPLMCNAFADQSGGKGYCSQ
jgi:hypothetical protein